MTIPSCHTSLQVALNFFLPGLAYFFLVFYTGVFISEISSLRNRKEAYKKYQSETNMIFPFPYKIPYF